MAALQVSSWLRLPTALQIFVHFPPLTVLEKNIQTNLTQTNYFSSVFVASVWKTDTIITQKETFPLLYFFLTFYLCYLYFYHSLWSTVVLYTPRRPFMKGKKQICCISDIYPSQKLCFSVLWKLITVDLLSKMGHAIPFKYFPTTSAANGMNEQTK